MAEILILSPASKSFRPIADLTEPNKELFAGVYGCDVRFPVHTDDMAELPWERIRFLRDAIALSEHDWVLFMGADTIFTNKDYMKHPIDFCAYDADLVMAVDANGLQSDVMFVRQCQATRNWLDTVLLFQGVARCEQDAMSVILGQAQDYGQYRQRFHATQIEARGWKAAHQELLNKSSVRVKIVDKVRINSTPEDWMENDFIFHAAGLAMENRIRELKVRL